jgi:hypothetical protein
MAFKTYKDVSTGKYASYPEDLAALYYDTLVEVDPDTLQCLDCAKHEVEVTEVVSNPKVTETTKTDNLKVTDDKSKDDK